MSAVKVRGDSAAHGAKVDEAVRALKRFAKSGLTDIDPDNKDHVSSYLTLRATVGRVDGKRLSHYLANKKANIQHGAASEMEYWGVPKTNFPDGLPEDIQEALVAQEDLQEAEVLGGGTFDHELYYIIDKCVPRHRLRKNVRSLKFFTGSVTKVGANAMSMSTGSERLALDNTDAGDPPQAVDPPQAAAGTQPQAAAGDSQPQAEPVERKRALVASGSDAPEPEEDKVAKRRRMLSGTLSDLRSAIKGAADSGKWHSNSDWCQDTVHFLVQELMQVLKNIIDQETPPAGATGPPAAATGADGPKGPEGPAPCFVKLLNKVQDFLVGIFTTRPMFDSVCHFKCVFTELKQMGADETGEGKLIEMLANVESNSVNQLDMSQVDVVDRTNFRHTTLYKSYCERIFQRLLDNAKAKLAEAATGACKDLLESALRVRPVSQGLVDTANCAFKFFCSSSSEIELLEMFMKDKVVLGKMLQDWGPKQHVTLACQLLSDEANFDGWSFDKWLIGAKYLVKVDPLSNYREWSSVFSYWTPRNSQGPWPGSHRRLVGSNMRQPEFCCPRRDDISTISRRYLTISRRYLTISRRFMTIPRRYLDDTCADLFENNSP